MTDSRDPRYRRSAGSSDRDRALARVTKVTLTGGAGAVVATAALAVWLSQPAHAKPGSAAPSTSSGSSDSSDSSGSAGNSSGTESDRGDGGLQLPDTAPGAGDTGGSQQPPVSSGGS
jgi:hypothetical protein